jgi:HAMP domain-containing protein
MLLSALGVALVIFLVMMSRCTRALQPLKDFGEQEPPKNNAVR